MKVLSFLLLFTFINAEFFSAIEELEYLSVNEEKLKGEYKNLIVKLEKTIVLLERNVAKIEKEQSAMSVDQLNYILNPLNAFLLIKRLSVDIVQMSKRLNKIAEDFQMKSNEVRIDDDDFDGAAEGLSGLQEVYGLRTEDLANEIIQDQKCQNGMAVDDLFSMGVFLMGRRQYTLSLSYLNLALEKNNETFDMSQLEILEEVYQNYNSTGNRTGAVETIDKILVLQPERRDLKIKKLEFEIDELREINPTVDTLGVTVSYYERSKTLALTAKVCSGELTKSQEEISKLRCRFDSRSAFSKLAPFKLEEANLNPYIVIFHDIISDKEIEVFKSESEPALEMAMVLNDDFITSRVDEVRRAKSSWHKDVHNEVFARLSKRLSDLTGLNMATAEDWQTQNYGIGGHYAPHYDFFEDAEQGSNQNQGNRTATTLIYLSDVERGGATVFPYLRVKISPKKGSAAFWYNLSTSGHFDYLTLHSGCPVLIGSKWVSNKWIRAFGQERTRPCELSPAIIEEIPWD